MSLRIVLKEEVEREFREVAMRKFGFGKGALSKAAEEAIISWIQINKKESFSGDPVEAIDGLLADVEMDSLTLQHAVKKLWHEKLRT